MHRVHMLHGTFRNISFFVGMCLLAALGAQAQKAPSAALQPGSSIDLAATYSPERAELAPGNCGCFWLQGGGVDAAYTFWKGLGAAVSLTGNHAGNVAPGVDINKITFTAGPRFTRAVWSGHGKHQRLQLFGQALFGDAHGFNGVYPAPSSVKSSADSLAIRTGGGLNLFLSKNLGLRVLEVDYVRSALPNNAADTQNDVQFSFGVVYRLGIPGRHPR